MLRSLKLEGGQEFGRWTVLAEFPRNEKKQRMFLCYCECGVRRAVRGDALISGKSKGCGCVKAWKGRSVHGFSSSKNRHPLYSAWSSMKKRCDNPKSFNYQNYGGRGIAVYPAWKNDPMQFIEWGIANGWQRGLQLDRIDNDGHYEPSNCRFVTAKANANNRIRGSKHRLGGLIDSFLSLPG